MRIPALAVVVRTAGLRAATFRLQSPDYRADSFIRNYALEGFIQQCVWHEFLFLLVCPFKIDVRLR
jgi:hypothetical protein